MRLQSLLLSAIASLAIAPILHQPAQAQETPQCQLSKNCIYGPEISDRWIKGQQLEGTGDFEGAMAEYDKAFKASVDLQLPNMEEERLALLRFCAASSSLAHMEGVKRGLEFMASHQMHVENLKMAAQISRDRFREVLDEEAAKTPELANRCP
jgi:hypothetical protein